MFLGAAVTALRPAPADARPATCWSGRCFCESVAASGLAQPGELGVLANLALYFAVHTLFAEVSATAWGP